MNYQGEQVNFSQVSDSDFMNLTRELGRTNQQVRTNSQNLVKMGEDMTVMGKNDTYFGDSITRLDSVVNGLTDVWQKTVSKVGMNTSAIRTNSDNLVQIGEDHKNMGKGGGGNPFDFLTSLTGGLGISTAVLAAGGLGAYLLLRKK